ncbi:hypothetical protein E2C01_068881 [Portunus trituberculatus]|uniref:Uncharacterized protein n=1 Tax=Portunus trituberculatus TaxID=210409 RepID=A0A5B7HNL3_PORTR|nr:hypothetical protein [Portunus trituberculatus]
MTCLPSSTFLFNHTFLIFLCKLVHLTPSPSYIHPPSCLRRNIARGLSVCLRTLRHRNCQGSNPSRPGSDPLCFPP